MMPTSTSIYSGDLRTQSVHTQSGETYITDAPVDNEGKGEAFSPTDIVATSLANCMLTIMGIVSSRKGLDLEGIPSRSKPFLLETMPMMVSMQLAREVATISVGENASPLPSLSTGASVMYVSPD